MAVSPNPEIMKRAIERCGSDVASLKKKWPRIDRWLDGTAKPTLKQIEDFAKKTHINLNLLFAEATPELGLRIADFRTLAHERKLPSPELYDTVNQMLFRQDWMRSYFSEQEYDAVDLVGMFNETDIANKEVRYVADVIRGYFNLKETRS